MTEISRKDDLSRLPHCDINCLHKDYFFGTKCFQLEGRITKNSSDGSFADGAFSVSEDYVDRQASA